MYKEHLRYPADQKKIANLMAMMLQSSQAGSGQQKKRIRHPDESYNLLTCMDGDCVDSFLEYHETGVSNCCDLADFIVEHGFKHSKEALERVPKDYHGNVIYISALWTKNEDPDLRLLGELEKRTDVGLYFGVLEDYMRDLLQSMPAKIYLGMKGLNVLGYEDGSVMVQRRKMMH